MTTPPLVIELGDEVNPPLLIRIGDQEYLITRSTVIGREGDITIDDEYASPRHIRLRPDGREWVVEDLDSTNGTWLQRFPLRGMTKVMSPEIVRKGDQVRIGSTLLILVPM